MNAKQARDIRLEVQRSLSLPELSLCSFGPVRELPHGEWEMTIECADHRMVLHSDRGDIILAFSPIGGRLSDRFALQVLIYYLSHGATFVGRISQNSRERRGVLLDRLGALLRRYRTEIVPLFGHDYDSCKPELLLAKGRYIGEFMHRAI